MASVKILESYTADLMAANDVRYCDAIIFVKDEHRALMYKLIIDTYSGGRNTDHISGNVMIITDPKTDKIEGLMLVGRNRLPSGIKTSYPFKLQSKNYSEEGYKELLDRFGCASEKELRSLWQNCATKFSFPLLMESEDQNTLSCLILKSREIIEAKKNEERQAANKDLDKFVATLTKWFTNKFGKNYTYEKNWSSMEWRVTARDGYGTKTYKVVLNYFRNGVDYNTTLYVSALDRTFQIAKGVEVIDTKKFKTYTDKIENGFDRWKDVIVAQHKMKEVFD